MSSFEYIIGIDEAGRGPLAGPVYVGLVYVPVDFNFSVFKKLDDSKKITKKVREEIFEKINQKQNESLQVKTTYTQAKTIDKLGITKAIQLAINRGLRQMNFPTEKTKIFLDGTLKAPRKYNQKTVVRGDQKVPVISLASVLAKVSRDRQMSKLGMKYPDFELKRHKGYGTKKHRQLVAEKGMTEIHRQSFCSNIDFC